MGFCVALVGSHMPSFPYHSQLAETWIAQFRDLAGRLACQPRHRAAWRWQIQVKILMYLILRYGSDPRLDERCPVAGTNVPPVEFPRVQMHTEVVRSQFKLRQILERIAEINRFNVI